MATVQHSLATLQGRILAGQVLGLQEDIRNLLGGACSGGEGQLIIRTCSKFVYENQGVNEGCFAAVLDIVSTCCECQHEQIRSEPFFHLKSMFYITLLALRRKELHHHCIRLTSSIEPYIGLCDTSKEEVQSLMRRMNSIVWNASLTMTVPIVSLTLQGFALHCSLAIGSSLSQVCEQAVKAHIVYANTEKSPENSDRYFQGVFKYLTETLSKQKTCNEASVLAIVSLIMEYARVAMEVGKYSDFGRNNKVVVKVLESHCDSKMVMGLKAGLKLPEMAIAMRLGKCGEEMLRKLLGSCGHVSALPGPNTVLSLGLVTTLSLLQQPPCSNLKLTSCIIELLMKRCKTSVSDETVMKVSSVLEQQLMSVFDVMTASPDSQPDTLFSHVETLADVSKPFILSHLAAKPDRMVAVYSFGVHFGNFGSLAYRKSKYQTAAKFLEVTVDLFELYCTHASEGDKVWSDMLRYGGHHWEAGLAVARGFLMGCLPAEDLVTAWVKCKRDAKKSGSEALRDLTVCDLVREARMKHKEADGVVFDKVAALLKEIQCYKQQKYSTVEEQLCCGRAVASAGQGVESHVRGLLVVVEVLWTHPNAATVEQEATEAAQEAKELLQEAKAGDGTNKPIFLELEALVHFWQYLCYMQMMYTKADAEVKEEKKPNPFTAHAPEPGEEEQVHDRCEGRPTTLLSLHTQHTSLAPLQTALDTWDKFVSEDLPLENAAVTCASLTSVGYIYHLSGLLAPTVQAWGLLVSLARKYSLHNYLVKGIVELILTSPELVDGGLVKEMQEAVSCSVPSSSQDTSHACLVLSATVATAFLYYKTGQYRAGVGLVQEALQAEVLTKRTIKTTEVETLVHLVASLYAWLPPWLLHPCQALPAPCFSLALLACRQANALVMMALTDANTEVICWRHRVASLLLTTTAWLGHLSIVTAQPRVARAYIGKSLQFSQQLILPLRIAECLEMMARVDVLCDQLEDCRVKVDSLEALLSTHPSAKEELQDLMPEFSKLTVSKPPKSRKKRGPEIFCDPLPTPDGERMRAESGTQDLHLKRCLPMPFQGGAEAGCLSPTVGHLENAAVVRFSACRSGGVNCAVCATPLIGRLRISTAVLLGLLHAHNRRFQAAQKCLDQAQLMYTEAAGKAKEMSSYISSFLKRNGQESAASTSSFVHSSLSLVHLQTCHAQAECLALEGRYDRALTTNLQCLQALTSQDTQLLVQDMHFVAVLSLQGQALEKVIRSVSKPPEDTSPPVITVQDDDEVPATTATTPKMSSSSRREATSSTKSLLNAPKPVHRRNLIFSIPSDDEERNEEENGTAPLAKLGSDATPRKTVMQTPRKTSKSAQKKLPTSARKRENAENKNTLKSLAADWDDALTLPSLVFKVPSDLPLSSLNSPSHHPSQSKGDKVSLATSPKSTSKIRNATQRTTTKAATGRGKTITTTTTTTTSQTPEDKPQRETAPTRGRSRAAKATSSSTSKAKVPECKPTARTRASRSLRLI